MNDPQSQQCNALPMLPDQQMSLADLATAAAMAEPAFPEPQASACTGVPPSQETTQCMQPPQARPPCMKQAASTASCRHVQFHEARIVGTVPPCSQMSQEDKEEIWYSNTSLDKFKNQVRSMCRKLRECPKTEAAALATTPEIPPDAMSTATDTSDEANPRGLEHRVCRLRLRNKQVALRCVLKAQMRSSCPDFIANISSKCTFWAKEIARNEGSRDFAAAYSHEDTKQEDLNASVASLDISTNGSATTESTCNTGVMKKEKPPCLMSRLVKAKRSCSMGSESSDCRPRKACRFSGNNCSGGSLMNVFNKNKKECDS